jgi:hypothetical protein
MGLALAFHYFQCLPLELFVVVFHAKLKILVIGSSEHQRETNEQVSPAAR